MDTAERDRLRHLPRTADRDRFTVGCALVRVSAGAWLRLPPADVRIDRRCPDCGKPHGRPKVPGSDLNLFVSHSGDRGVVAAAPAPSIGVDVEVHEAGIDVARLAPYVLAPAELTAFRALPPHEQRPGFYRT
jgi:4'-phosphopantetheinyl transferase